MLDFLIPKTRIQAHNFQELPIETLQILGLNQVNPYCNIRFDTEIFFTIVSFSNEVKEYDEKEGIIESSFFTKRRCPKCKKIELFPVHIKINLDSTYLKHEEEIAFDAFEEHPSRRHFPTNAQAYCNNCGSCFDFRIKNKDIWIKESKKIKTKDLISKKWEEYQLD